MKGPQGRRGQQKARQEKAKGEGQPSPHWLATLTDYQLRGFILASGTLEEKGPFLAELARRGRGERGITHAEDC